MPQHFDAIVIGAGQAGPPLANRLSAAGQKVAIVEREHVGGTCVNNGCMPTKTMVASAYAAHLARRATEYGVKLEGGVAVDMALVKARKDRVVHNASHGVEFWLRSMNGLSIIRGDARFVSPGEIEVGSERLQAPRIFINVGGRPLIPPIPGIEAVNALTNEIIMDLDILPDHLIVLGGSYIGLEFAQMFRRFGAKVSVIEAAPRLVAREDEDVSAAILDILAHEGIDVRVATSCKALRAEAGGVVAQVDTNGVAGEIKGSHLLVAIGRTPNTDRLGLQNAGIEVDERGFIKTDEQLRTTAQNVWALGDCNGRGAFTHTSFNDYEIVAANLLDNARWSVNDRIPTYGLFIDPPLGRVGMTEREARASGRLVLIGKRPMSRVGRAVEKGETLGFMKILVDANTKRILGAAILGVSGDEAVHCITATMYADAPYTVLKRAVQIHPTVSELIPTVLGELAPLT
jgi:pyruvate/2-oxoglutarate dehydrogenase complex dihydrolipoamide dehydrogenase (E3) component